ncbi:MAG: RNA polymerase sigma factor [Pseudomonadota bacterium]
MSSKATKLADWSLMVRVGQGCDQAFEKLYQQYHPRIVRFLQRRLSDQHVIESVASDTLLTARQKSDQFFGACQLSTWLFGIAYRKALREGDRENRRQNALPEVTYSESVNGTNRVSRVREIGDLLRVGLDRLPANQRQAVVCHLVEGLSLEEAAEKLGIPVGTVKNRIFQARKALKLQLAQTEGA